MVESIIEERKMIKISKALKERKLSRGTKAILTSYMNKYGDEELEDSFYSIEDITRINKERIAKGEKPRFTFESSEGLRSNKI